MHQSNEAVRTFDYFVQRFGTKRLMTYERCRGGSPSADRPCQCVLKLTSQSHVMHYITLLQFLVGGSQNRCKIKEIRHINQI